MKQLLGYSLFVLMLVTFMFSFRQDEGLTSEEENQMDQIRNDYFQQEEIIDSP
ncbi:hypothetical protein [Bacillus sp. FJAT-44742]|uniref:hypothetical protein n=1 Tax=Bacillus sp. FJAT-44742 TaxID=2014005 RepID=UPI0012FEFB29|nr:hypothetical protein [Bacillus sp. FJAT-44742]